MNLNRQVEPVLVATLANTLDLMTSYLDFSLYGLQELNYYVTTMHLGNYLAATMAFITYEAVILAIYLAMPRLPGLRWFMAVFITMKFIAVAGNIAAAMGFYGINNAIITASQFLTKQSLLFSR